MNFNKTLQNIRFGWLPIVVIAVTTIAFSAISIYYFSSGVFIIFQNLFYIPIIIACMYYTKKGFAFSVALSFIYLFLIIVFTSDSAVIIQALTRVFIFVGVAGVTTFLSIKRKRVEAALLDSTRENAFQAELLRKAPAIVAFHDRDQNIVWANQAYEEATGLSLQDIAGKKCYSVWNLSGPCQGCPVLTAIATGKNSEAELTPQNQEHWPESQGYWLSKASPVRDQEGSIIGAT